MTASASPSLPPNSASAAGPSSTLSPNRRWTYRHDRRGWPASSGHATDQRLTAQAAELGFADSHVYLTDRLLTRAWLLADVAAELGATA